MARKKNRNVNSEYQRIESYLPKKWYPTLPLAERIQRLVQYVIHKENQADAALERIQYATEIADSAELAIGLETGPLEDAREPYPEDYDRDIAEYMADYRLMMDGFHDI